MLVVSNGKIKIIVVSSSKYSDIYFADDGGPQKDVEIVVKEVSETFGERKNVG